MHSKNWSIILEYFLLLLIFLGSLSAESTLVQIRIAGEVLVIILTVICYIIYRILKPFGIRTIANKDNTNLIKTAIALMVLLIFPLVFSLSNDFYSNRMIDEHILASTIVSQWIGPIISPAATFAALLYPLLIGVSFLENKSKNGWLTFGVLVISVMIDVVFQSFLALGSSYLVGKVATHIHGKLFV